MEKKPSPPMAGAKSGPQNPEGIEIDLRDPIIAGLLAWLWPGAGHLYQRRYAKGVLFMACILGTFVFGLILGEGKVVYASQFRDPNAGVKGISGILSRWPYGLQIGVGIPAMPAIAQSLIAKKGGEPILGGFMASPQNNGELNQWNEKLGTRYDIALLYTVVAGLLNWLAIYDAACGPAFSEPAEDARPPDEKKRGAKKNEDEDDKKE